MLFRSLRAPQGQSGGGQQLMTLTTPVAYITSYFSDPFTDTKGATTNYSRDTNTFGAGWIAWSFGPDTDEQQQGVGAYTDGGGDIGLVQISTVPFVETAYYNPAQTVPSVTLINATYDPTNGTSSNGDVYRLKQ